MEDDKEASDHSETTEQMEEHKPKDDEPNLSANVPPELIKPTTGKSGKRQKCPVCAEPCEYPEMP